MMVHLNHGPNINTFRIAGKDMGSIRREMLLKLLASVTP
jgi:hypothetical protein